jgi:hypothetical protein
VRQNRELAEFLVTVRTLSLITRLLQARRHAEELRRRELRLKPLIALFVAGTAPLVDAAAELGDTTTRDFETGDTASAFLRSRGLIAPDAAGLERLSQLAVGEDYLVAERIRLGTLLDLVATFLDRSTCSSTSTPSPRRPRSLTPGNRPQRKARFQDPVLADPETCSQSGGWSRGACGSISSSSPVRTVCRAAARSGPQREGRIQGSGFSVADPETWPNRFGWSRARLWLD